eukprot:CCRYP_010009-RA/>CCRYP_010009-RA protein AED:0.45 eAED:0.45 QI:0/0/0/1/1/1/2/0/108
MIVLFWEDISAQALMLDQCSLPKFLIRMYEDDDPDGHMPDPPDEEVDATPKVGDSYVKTEVMLSIGDHMARGKVVVGNMMLRELPLDKPTTIQSWTRINMRFSLQMVK